MMWEEGFGGGFWIFGWIMMVVVVALVVVGIVLLVRGLSGRPGSGSSMAGGQGSAGQPEGSVSAIQILEERYARGEIDQEEFLQRKKDLLGK